MIDFILKNWRWVGSFLAMAAVLGWFTWQDYRVTTLKRDLQTDTKAKIDA